MVIGENSNFLGAEDWLQKHQVQLKIASNETIETILREFIDQNPELWLEDIGQIDND